MRAIDADEFSKKWEGKIYEGDVRTLLDTAPTIEPRCETCEAFNKTRLLIPQPERKKGKWIEYDNSHCECPFCHEEWSYFDNETEHFNYCPNCGAEMRIPVEIARSIVHKVIDNSVWADSVDTAKMHKVVDDKYAEIRGDANVDAES